MFQYMLTVSTVLGDTLVVLISIILLLIFKILGIPIIIVAYILLSILMKITKKL